MSIVLFAGSLTWGQMSAEPRFFYSVVPAAGLVELGPPGGPSFGCLDVGGIPVQVRADLMGRGVVMDGFLPLVHLLDRGQFKTVPTPGPLRDAIPDGGGGAWILVVDASGASELWKIDREGLLWRAPPLPGVARKVRSLSDGSFLLLIFGPGLPTEVVRWEPGGGAVLGRLTLGGIPKDIVFDDAGRVLLPGALPDALPVLHQDLTLDVILPMQGPFAGVGVFAGGGLLVGHGWPTVVEIVNPSGPPLPALGLESPGAFEGLPSGEVLVHQPVMRLSWRFDVAAGPIWFGQWHGTFAPSDGAGLQHARSVDLDRDPDADGYSTRTELALGNDPGDAGSVPVKLELENGLLKVTAPRFPGRACSVAAALGVVPDVWPPTLARDGVFRMSSVPGWLFGMPLGGLGPHGEMYVDIRPLTAASWELQVAAEILDGVTLGLELLVPARPMHLW